MNLIIAALIGFILGKVKFNFKFKSNRIEVMRKNVNNTEWLLTRYKQFLEDEKDNKHFKDFECSKFFKGDTMAKHNTIIYERRKERINRQRKFIEKRIKVVSPNYYIKFIGDIPAEEMTAIRRNSKLNSLLS
jgi:pyruvate/2-oxoacid:ferredoxin oxidoreductase beta subunit